MTKLRFFLVQGVLLAGQVQRRGFDYKATVSDLYCPVSPSHSLWSHCPLGSLSLSLSGALCAPTAWCCTPMQSETREAGRREA